MNPWDDPRIVRGMTAQFALRRERLAAGAKPFGWKVGFGAPAAMQKFGTNAPLVGFLLDSGRLASDATATLAGWTKPVFEAEVAAYMGRDLAAGADRAAAASAIAGLGPAIELADLNVPPEDVEVILAGNIFHRHVILGPYDPARDGRATAGLTGRLSRNGADAATASDVEANTGKIVDNVQHVANLLAAFGERLRAGEVIICGSVIPPVSLDPSDKTLVFSLEPVGSVSVRLAHA